MVSIMILLIWSLFAEVNSVIILTVPTSCSYQLRQRVQFICEAEVQGNETITWNWFQNIYSGIYSRNDQNITTLFWIYIRHHSLFSCAVVSNKSVIDKARKVVEIQGLLQHRSPLSQLLILNKSVEFRVNISDLNRGYYFNLTLAWYHNNTRITTNERVNITDDGTTLTIADTVETDAGKYQVRIDSMNFSSGVDPPECHENILPLLEYLALYAPATFLLQQPVTRTCTSEDIITQYTIPDYLGEDQQSIIINTTIKINTSIVSKRNRHGLYKLFDSVSSDDYNYTELFHEDKIESIIEIKYNNSRNVVGDYYFTAFLVFNDSLCPNYVNYLENIYRFNYYGIPYISIYFSLSLSVPTINSSKSMPVLLGDYLTLTCSVYDSNETIFYWFLNDTILSGQSTNTYVISGVQLSDLGYYKCGINPNYTQSERFHVYYRNKPFTEQGNSVLSPFCHSQDTKDDILRGVIQFLVRDYGARPFGRVRVYPATSCQQVHDAHPTLGSGYYWISTDGEKPIETHCEF